MDFFFFFRRDGSRCIAKKKQKKTLGHLTCILGLEVNFQCSAKNKSNQHEEAKQWSRCRRRKEGGLFFFLTGLTSFSDSSR